MTTSSRSLKGLTPLMTEYMSVLVTLKPRQSLTLDEIRNRLDKPKRYNSKDPAIKSLLNRELVEMNTHKRYTRYFPTMRGRLVFMNDRPYTVKRKHRQSVDV